MFTNFVFDCPLQTVVAYFLGQMLGGYLGYGLLRVLFPNTDNGFCMTQPAIDTARAFGLEFVITAILMLVYCGVVDPRNADLQGETTQSIL